jgi:GT2 family glycosyltransferase
LDCLKSIAYLKNTPRIALLVNTTDSSLDVKADERVHEIVAQFPELDIFVFGSAERKSLFRRIEQLELGNLIEALSIRSYGAIRNLGCLLASIMGNDAIIFMDDDELIDMDDFFERAAFGLGHPIHSGGHLLAKTGMVTDMTGDFFQLGTGHLKHGDASANAALEKLAPQTKQGWQDRFWRMQGSINQSIELALRPPRLHRATMAFGGCLAIHREMFTKVAFDPWIMRGEDVDYVINARLHGGDVYIDDQWIVRHNSPESERGPAERFRQHVYRFIYEHRKLEFAKSQVDLAQVSAQSLMPYPGALVTQSIQLRAFITGILHSITGPDRKQYWRAAWDALGRANTYARKNCVNYFALQRAWSFAVDKLSHDVALKTLFSEERAQADRSARTSHTGSFSAW